MKKEKSELEQIKEWKRSLLLEGKMIQDIDEWNSLVEERNDLLEENKKLKEENEYRKSIVDIIPEGEGNVAEETIKDLQDRIKELKEEVRFLEECLDRKEKLNEKYRKEIEESHVYDAKQVRDIC